MSSGRLAIFGTDDHSRVVAEIVLTSRWEAVVFHDGRFSKNMLVDSHSVIRYLKNLVCDGESYGFSVIGANNIRFALVENALGRGLSAYYSSIRHNFRISFIGLRCAYVAKCDCKCRQQNCWYPVIGADCL